VNTNRVRRIAIAVWLCACPARGWALFTGIDQYNLADLNSEKRVDAEYFTHLLAYRPVWTPAPGEELPRAFFRTSEGSLDTKELFIRREAGYRAFFSTGTYLGYQLREHDDFEEHSFYQLLEGQYRLGRLFALRAFGQPTTLKQNSDIGGGVLIGTDALYLQADYTFVDFNFSNKNVSGETDRRRPSNTLLKGVWKTGSAAMETSFEYESPIKRALTDPDRVFNHEARRASVRFWQGDWRLTAEWEHHRRSIDDDAGVREQDFNKTAYRAEVEKNWRITQKGVRTGLDLYRRLVVYESSTTANRFDRQRWEAVPYVEWDWVWSPKVSMPLGVYTAFTWDRLATGASTERLSVTDNAFKLRVPLRIDFNQDVSLVLSFTWNLAQIGGTRTFGGGNGMFQARWP
jgi:hypothetical protein